MVTSLAACLSWRMLMHRQMLGWCRPRSPLSLHVLAMTLNCIHIFIVTASFLYLCVMRPASQRFYIYSCIYLQILIISYLTTFLGTNSLSVLMCRKAVNQSTVKSPVPPFQGVVFCVSGFMLCTRIILIINVPK